MKKLIKKLLRLTPVKGEKIPENPTISTYYPDETLSKREWFKRLEVSARARLLGPIIDQ